MSWSSRGFMPTRRVASVAVLALALTGCLRPLYGPTASGERLSDVLASLQVDNITVPTGQERLGHYLRSELVFDLDGSGQPRPKRYSLNIKVQETVQTAIVDTTTGRAEAATVVAVASFELLRTGNATPVTAGTATSSATYDRSTQRLASVRASRDAEIRVARLLADQLRIRLSAALATAS